MTSEATSGFGVQVQRGDGGVGAGVQASKSFGTSNQTLKILAKLAGVAGNSKTAAVVVAGVSTVFSIVVTANSVVINSATDGSSLATTKVGYCISQLYLNSVFDANFQATTGTGDGSGVLVAGASGALSGGSDGLENFTTIAEVKSVGGPNMQAQVIDITNMDSADNTREFLSNLIDPGELTFAMNFLPGSTNQQGIFTDFKNRSRRNFKLIWTDGSSTACSLTGIVTGFQITNSMESAMEANVTIKITGLPNWF
jgi:hypothetical protein